ncbi:hypothetical protein FKM82_009336 [Ascaphus truei]
MHVSEITFNTAFASLHGKHFEHMRDRNTFPAETLLDSPNLIVLKGIAYMYRSCVFFVSFSFKILHCDLEIIPLLLEFSELHKANKVNMFFFVCGKNSFQKLLLG